eukprot:10394122-Alexandrium_andersonii.AAC.1
MVRGPPAGTAEPIGGPRCVRQGEAPRGTAWESGSLFMDSFEWRSAHWSGGPTGRKLKQA